MQKDNQRRLLLLLKLLYEQTDETHFVSGADILRYWEDASIRANRKNVYGDIRLLLDAGNDIKPILLRHIKCRQLKEQRFTSSSRCCDENISISTVFIPSSFTVIYYFAD